MKLALFDFDGTITTEDTLLDFIQFVHGRPKYFFGLFALSPIMFGYAIGMIKTQRAKEWILRLFFRGMSRHQLEELGKQYCEERLPSVLNPYAIEELKWHRTHGHEIAVVSASPECWVQPWTEKMGYKTICTKLQFKDDRFNGKIEGNNCQGKEKVIRIEAEYDLEKVEFIYAYGNSKGDKEMLALANEPYFRKFG